MSQILSITRTTKTDDTLAVPVVEPGDYFDQPIGSLPLPILLFANSKVKAANPTAAKLLGYATPTDVIGKQLKKIIHGGDEKLVAREAGRVVKGGLSSPMEVKMAMAEGTVIDVEIMLGLRDHAGNPVVEMIIRDITTVKQAQQRLLYRLEFEQLITSISGRFITLKPEAIEFEIVNTLMQLASFVGVEHCYVFLFSDDCNYVDNVLEWGAEDKYRVYTQLRGSSTAIFPYLIARLQDLENITIPRISDLPATAHKERAFTTQHGIQSMIWVPIINGKKPVGVLGLDSYQSGNGWADDIIDLLKAVAEVLANALERKRTEEALLRSEDLFSKAFHLSPTPMCITKLSDGRIIDVNESFYRMLGFVRDEMIGRTSVSLKLWRGKNERDQMLSELTRQRVIRNMEMLLTTKAGEERVALASYEIVEINGEDHLLGVFVDLTERIRMDKEMNRLERLHLIGEMAASIGHEIRNPLTSVKGFLQVLSEKDACLIYRDFFGLMIDELDRANSIITEFLALAKNRSIELKLQNLNPIIATLFPLIMADSANSDTIVNLDLKGTPQLMLDEKEIRQLVLNLVRNGKEAMVKGGNLTIRCYQEGDEVILAVEDQGPGIPQNIIESLGTPFFTTKEAGTGLGLAVCYSIVARHKALMDFTTGPGGTTFAVRFRIPDNGQKKHST